MMRISILKEMTATDAFALLRHLPMPFIFSGHTVGQRRHSYVGADPLAIVKTSASLTETTYPGTNRREASKDPFEAISRLITGKDYLRNTTFPFNGGAVGYFAYDLKDSMTPEVKHARPRAKLHIDVPECIVGIYDPIFVFDHLRGHGYLVSYNEDAYRFEKMLDILRLDRATEEYRRRVPDLQKFLAVTPESMTMSVTREDYVASIKKAHEYIAAGDIYQINLSQRIKVPIAPGSDPLALYMRLLEMYHAPFNSLMDFGDFQVISNSPERLLKVHEGMAETMPIKGTRKRGLTPEQDEEMIRDLKTSVKERSEHVMIVDLERSDLGKICEAGSIEVPEFEVIHTYPHLHHMTSVVRGKLSKDVTATVALKSIFPGGSVTGTPKIRAMEIIAELEEAERGIYTGGIGWIDYSGEADVAMAIRTAVCKDGYLYLSVGGGIVADSDPEEEYKETLLKAGDFLGSMGVDLRGNSGEHS